MTDNSPKVVAAANLTPLSPKPINLSSPIVVPALQDQADILYTMSLSPTLDPHSAPVMSSNPSDEQASTEHFAAQQAPSMCQSPDQGAAATEKNAAEADLEDGDTEADEDDYAKNFDSPVAEAFNDGEVDISKAIKSSHASISSAPLTSPAIEAPPDKPASTNVTSGVEPKPIVAPASEPSLQAESQAGPEASLNDEAAGIESASDANNMSTNSVNAPKPDDVKAIQALVDDITARAAASEPNRTASSTTENAANTKLPNAVDFSTLPPRPPTTVAYMRSEDLRRFHSGAPFPHATTLSYPPAPAAHVGMPYPATPSGMPYPPAAGGVPYPQASAGMPYPYAAPGTMSEVSASLPPPPTAMIANPNATMPMPHVPVQVPMTSNDTQQTFDVFLQEERKYVSEAKWDRFPEGSRLFIGNLSSDRVTKKEVFEIFSRYGRLAQISLKQAYGFVQYHNVAEGHAAMNELQGIDINGRKVHLEFSRMQKKENDGDKNRGNRDRDGQRDRDRGRGGGYQNDRECHDNRRRDDYRARSPSPGRGNHYRQNSSSYGRDRDQRDHGRWGPAYDRAPRGRSRSPAQYGGGYRRRTPSPYRRGPRTSEADLDIPRRYASDVPDVQLFLLEEVDREFVDWVLRSFSDRGLKGDVMFLNPRFPRDLVIQRQVVEGVHAVSELDFHAQSLTKIPLQVFDRSNGRHNVRFDLYQDLEPKIAAELVARAKFQARLQPSSGDFGGRPNPAPSAYGPTARHPAGPPQPQPYAGQPPANPALGALSAVGQLGNLSALDPATLQQVLATYQAMPQAQVPQAAPHGHRAPQALASSDLNAVLSALGTNSNNSTASALQQSTHGSSNSAQHVSDIMAQLARYRQ